MHACIRNGTSTPTTIPEKLPWTVWVDAFGTCGINGAAYDTRLPTVKMAGIFSEDCCDGEICRRKKPLNTAMRVASSKERDGRAESCN